MSTFKILKGGAAEPQRDPRTLSHMPRAYPTGLFLTLWEGSKSFSMFMQLFSKRKSNHMVLQCCISSMEKDTQRKYFARLLREC